MPCCLRLLAIKVAPSISPISFLLVTDRLPRRDYAFIAAAEKRFAARGTCHAAGRLLSPPPARGNRNRARPLCEFVEGRYALSSRFHFQRIGLPPRTRSRPSRFSAFSSLIPRWSRQPRPRTIASECSTSCSNNASAIPGGSKLFRSRLRRGKKSPPALRSAGATGASAVTRRALARTGPRGHRAKGQQSHPQHQPLLRGRKDWRNGVRQKRRYSRQYRRVVAARARLNAPPLFVRATLIGLRGRLPPHPRSPAAPHHRRANRRA